MNYRLYVCYFLPNVCNQKKLATNILFSTKESKNIEHKFSFIIQKVDYIWHHIVAIHFFLLQNFAKVYCISSEYSAPFVQKLNPKYSKLIYIQGNIDETP